MQMELVEFACASCGLNIREEEAPDLGESEGTFTRVFWCPGEHRHMLLDAEAPGFRGHCPDCDAKLAILKFPLAACPKCLAPTRARRAFTGPL